MDWKCSIPDKSGDDKNIRGLMFFRRKDCFPFKHYLFFIYTLQDKQNVFAITISAYTLIVP